ncbi:hypothetical protein JCM31447_14860 [Fluviispira sanaruensis]|uniref:Uncharacterized protein n=1 Tax=Fluviispira sanaruensis TaxID=2493639 RepID=A0A4P2VIQ9_FLUSA|nr:hypothetical protein JCM31447_14860 [Fluviispira sanaruensis]
MKIFIKNLCKEIIAFHRKVKRKIAEIKLYIEDILESSKSAKQSWENNVPMNELVSVNNSNIAITKKICRECRGITQIKL